MIRVQVSCVAVRDNRVALVRKVNNPMPHRESFMNARVEWFNPDRRMAYTIVEP